MTITIDNLDGAGPRDYTAFLDAERLPVIWRRLNQPDELEGHLVTNDSSFVMPAIGARLVLARSDGRRLFTGYLVASPSHAFMGTSSEGPAHRYQLKARGDEAALDRRTSLPRAPMVARTAGGAIRQLVTDIAPGQFNVSAVQDLDVIPSVGVSLQRRWSEQARDIATRARAVVRIHDGAVSLASPGAVVHAIDEADANFSPHTLSLQSPDRLLNDVTVIGRVEPREYVKDYFLGDGLTLSFNMSASPFTRRAATVFEEEFRGTTVDPLRWIRQDPAAAITVTGGRLRMQGGNGADGQTTLTFVEQVELGGAFTLQHGELELTAASNGVIGGLYNGTTLQANCFAGFRIAPSGSQSTIRAFINGASTGPTITTVAGHRYLLTTHIHAAEPYRLQQAFHSSTHPAGNPRGGTTVSSTARVVLEVHDVDPANPGTFGGASTILYDAVLSAPAFCTYALLNVMSVQGTLNFTRMLRAIDAEVRSTVPGQPTRTRLVGTIAEGAECVITQDHDLQFFSPFVPVANEAITVRYRNRGRAQARVLDAASIAAHARQNDNGVRAGVLRVLLPTTRTASDCENAAAALLDDGTQQAWSGSYECWSDFLPGGAALDPLPGDAVAVHVPSRGANFTAILREVTLKITHPADDRSRYQLRFANDAAEPLGCVFDEGILREPLDAVMPGAAYIGNLPDAEITSVTSTTVTINTGTAAPSGGGFEVRRTDFGWGTENDRNLVGRFTSQSFAVPRLARIQTYHVRQYDDANPRRYSRYSTVLHVDYPF